MLQSIRNFTKGKLSKVLLVILIIPFVLWGMGDVFRGGSQSTIATLNKEKISITDYIDHFNSLNVNREFIIKNPETKIFEQALNKLVSGKVLVEEAKKIGIVITEKSLSQIIKNDPEFLDNDKFSRTKYEKFLIERNISAVEFEKILKDETLKKLFVQLVTDGINSPKFLVENTYNVFNQEKKLEFINLDKIYKKNFSDEDINNFYLEKKDNFLQEFKKIKFSVLTPQNLTNTDEFSELFFNKIDEIDNLIASKISLNDIAQRYSLKVENSPEINIDGADLNGNKKDVLSNEILKEIFASEFVDQAQLTSGNNQFLIYEVISSENKLPTLNNKKVKKNLIEILTAKNVIEKNQEIQKNIIFKKSKQLRLEEMKKIAKDLNITINATSINNINDKNAFKEEGILSQIYSMNENDIAIVSSKDYKKNYLVFIKETINTKLKDGNNEYEKYLKISNSNLSNKILGTYDLYLNKQYKVDINQKALDKVKNMYQ